MPIVSQISRRPGPTSLKPASPKSSPSLAADDSAAARLDDKHVLLEQCSGHCSCAGNPGWQRGLLQPTMAATPRMRPDMMASFSGRKEAR